MGDNSLQAKYYNFKLSLSLRDDKEYIRMTMNLFYDLPDDLQDMIYFETHKLNYKDTFSKIKTNKFLCRDGDGYAVQAMTDVLYSLNATKTEIEDFFSCLDWLDGKRIDTPMEELLENKYYHVYYEYWNRI
tara:strand:+ start:481 stop:873 length:393 start_codon:yes stop_codon:yes gene_type:complete